MYHDLPVWAFALIALALTHVTIAAVTIYLHRHQAHRALDLHPAVAHFFRFWLWLTTAMLTREWIAVHRRHHAAVETADDPHSPQVHGIRTVLLQGAELYRRAADRPEILQQYGHGAPDDWLERNLYSRHRDLGIVLMLLANLILFGAPGLVIWAVQMIWIPLFAAGVVNGVGHWWGYRNFEPADASTNIVPLGILIGGEELHNNHHAFAGSARFSSRWYEFDIGWLYIRTLQNLGLARVRKLPPMLVIDSGKQGVDLETVHAVVGNRFEVLSRYTRDVVSRVYREERSRADNAARRMLRGARLLLVRNERLIDEQARRRLETVLAGHQSLEVVYQFGQRLQDLWKQRMADQEKLLEALQQWCREAEETGIAALQEFARSVRGFRLQTA
jgi:stearoyl-CoA desaturase (delta-9 desaturase)